MYSMYAQLTDPRKETLYSRYVPTQKTLSPQGLLSQSNLEKKTTSFAISKFTFRNWIEC